jgi:hypothetical protein
MSPSSVVSNALCFVHKLLHLRQGINLAAVQFGFGEAIVPRRED